MAKYKFTLDKKGVRNLLRGESMQAVLNEKAGQVQASCGTGYKSDSYVGRNRANAMVYADTYKAKRDNLKNNTILKALR
ncbi:uncharacterized protein BN738_01170 [Peptostreptococcus anaerobius CAG:621]|jgi:hypothetical protein|uniref:hypothetical protein n=1 Tax=Peptostreptococcus anaerobius TaxID=1261 RepID=UPI0003413570|nr:hypothetical protein [Peptostreptococcus anaerobius]CCY49917.1 uncharacterized protein BN738_01170 [Peptostreptococcus anaerobius CAG:621]